MIYRMKQQQQRHLGNSSSKLGRKIGWAEGDRRLPCLITQPGGNVNDDSRKHSV
jgi:hypothetical protein